MKRRYFLLLAVICLLGLLLARFALSPSSKEMKAEDLPKISQKVPPPVPSKNPQKPLSDDQKFETSGEAKSEGLALLNDQKIKFYGKAIDQNEEPVVDADVVCSVIIRNGRREGMEKHSARTDSSGYFELHGFSGESIGVAVNKEGYEQRANSAGFYYSILYREKVHKPDPNNPVIFKMWKLAGAEPIIHGGWAPIFPYGSLLHFDLVTGKQVQSGGDMILIVSRPPLPPGATRAKGFDWSAQVQIVGGGLIEQSDPFPYVAPQSGYVPTFEVNMVAGTTNWTEQITKNFYVQLRSGKMYGRLKIQLNAFFNEPTQCQFEFWTNPSGSRNLEYDPNLGVTPARIEQIGFKEAIEEVKARGGK